MPVYPVKSVLFRISVFCIAMGFFESAVVIYLRELYYPGGFEFPLTRLPEKLALTEFLRELATLIMLLTLGWISGQNFRQRFAGFIYGFAVWDIFYYVFLKWLTGWPESWFTWDVLFLIPVIWTGPVITPVLVSVTMIFLALSILDFDNKSGGKDIRRPIIHLIIIGSVLIFLSFIWDYSGFIMHNYQFDALFRSGLAARVLDSYIPATFNWWLFLAGETAEIAAILMLLADVRSTRHTS